MKRLIDIALSQYGVTERQGSEHNPIIVNYSKVAGFNGIIDDETAWCSIFMNWCAKKAGLKTSNELFARSWLAEGQPISTPKTGDIVVFWRESITSWKGHVGIYISHSEDGQHIYCLGGNQNNAVNIKAYPSKRLLGYRRLTPINP